MPKLKVLARNWGIYTRASVGDGSTTYDEYQKIGGLETFTLSPDAEETDTTDFDSQGYDTHIIGGRSNEIELEGSYIEDPETGDRDAGQQLIEDLGTKIGHESIDKFRLVSPAGTTTEYNVSAKVGEKGGGVKDKTSWGATLKVSGKPVLVDTQTDNATYLEVMNS